MIIGKKDRIFLAGHKGMVGSAIYKKLTQKGFINIATRKRKNWIY